MKERWLVFSFLLLSLIMLHDSVRGVRRIAFCFLGIWIGASLVGASLCFGQGVDPTSFVYVKRGNLPIIISAPHGGNDAIPGVPERTGVGVTDFVTVRDTGTEELAYALESAIRQRFGKSPYVVVGKVDRRYVDLNRSAANAYEHPDAAVVYNHYHRMLRLYTRTVANRFHAGLVVDLHGQGQTANTVYRGTRDGATVRHLRMAFGLPAHDGPSSLFGLLAARGWTVHPQPLSDPEHTSFNGGFIVGTYGSQQATAVDAMQFEFGSNYRSTATARSSTAAILASELANYARLYLKVRVRSQ